MALMNMLIGIWKNNSELGMSIYLSPNELKELHKAIGIMMKDDN